MRNFLIIIICHAFLFAGDGRWESITPIKKIDKLVVYDDIIYGSSRGGVVEISQGMRVSYYTNTEGLGGVVTRDITTNNNGVFAITSANCLSYFDGDNWSPTESLDLNEWNTVYAANDRAWVSYVVGVIVFQSTENGWQYRDFFNQFPAALGLKNTVVEFSDRIYLFSDLSVVSAPADYLANNLKNVQNWDDKDFFNPGETLISYAEFDNKLILSTTDSLYILNANHNIEYLVSTTPIVKGSQLFSDASGLYALSGNAIFKYENEDWSQVVTLDGPYKSFVKRNDAFVVSSFYSDLFIFPISGDGKEEINLNRPLGLRFRKFITDDQGNIFAATTGFYGGSPDRAAYYYNGIWYDLRVIDEHFNQSGYGNTILSVNKSAGGEMIWSTYGRGLYIQRGITDFELINRSGSRTAEFRINNEPFFIENNPAYNDYLGYVSAENDTTFVITHDMITDISGNVWITNHFSHTFRTLICVKPESTGDISLDSDDWLYWDLRVPYSSSLLYSTIGAIEIDVFEYVWVGSRYEGLARLNYNNTLENQSDDSWRVFNSQDGLFSNQVLAIGSDANGTVFVGTDNGLNMISGNNVYQLKGDYAPKGSRINGIARDAKGNLWFASDLGVSMLESNKNAFEPASWIHFNAENSDLLTDFCHGIYADSRTGKLYIGTEMGISVYKSPLLENPESNLETLAIGPNPFKLTSGRLLISGISNNSGLKILSQTGVLIRYFAPSEIISGVVYWDGRNKHNEVVASGVYVLVASNEEGNIQTAKVLTFR